MKRPLGGEYHSESLYLGDTFRMSSKNAPDVWQGGECSHQTQGSQLGCSSWADSALKRNVGTARDIVGCHNSGRQGEGDCFWHQGPVGLLNNLQRKGLPPHNKELPSPNVNSTKAERCLLPQINRIPAAISRTPNHPIWNKYLPPPWPGSYLITQVHLSCVCVYVCVCLVAQSCPTLCNPMDCSPPGSSVYGILQARTLKWVPIPFSRGSSQPRGRTWVSCMAVGFFTS